MDTKRIATHGGEIVLGNNAIPCFVLEDGTRVLSGRRMQEALRMVDVEEGKQTSGTRLQRYFNQKSLERFIYQGKELGHYDPLECYWKGKKISGYEATVLVDICDAFLEARKELKNLPSRQKIIADQCEILVRGFARVGIVALIDEATGYQYDRERFELQKILNAYVLDEAAKWQIMFGLDFYKQIYRLWGVPFTPQNIRRKPKFIAVLTNKYIYSQLPSGVYEKVKENNPKTDKGNYKHKHHQYLTTDIGREHQKKVIHEVTAIASISDNKEQFNKLYERKYSTEPIQLELEFNEEPPELSEFNKSLTRAIEYNEKPQEY
jgi:hypothetical protein